MRKLLVVSPARRLGAAKNGATGVKEHAWFRDFDWESFAKKSMKAPYVPVVRLHILNPPSLRRSRLCADSVHSCMFWYACGTHNDQQTMLHDRTLQVSSPEDTRNFDMSNTEAAWSGDDKWKRYISLGDFKNF